MQILAMKRTRGQLESTEVIKPEGDELDEQDWLNSTLISDLHMPYVIVILSFHYFSKVVASDNL